MDYENCIYTKKLIDKLVAECSENIDENEMIHHDYRNVHNSCTTFFVSFVIVFLIMINISNAYFNFTWQLKKDITCVKFITTTQTM